VCQSPVSPCALTEQGAATVRPQSVSHRGKARGWRLGAKRALLYLSLSCGAAAAEETMPKTFKDGRTMRDTAPVTDWAFAMHQVGVDRELARSRWPEYTPEAAAPVGRTWRGSSLGEFRHGSSWNSSPISSFATLTSADPALPRLNHLMGEKFRQSQHLGPSGTRTTIESSTSLGRSEAQSLNTTLSRTVQGSPYGRPNWKKATG
jgi:hypothetical protein